MGSEASVYNFCDKGLICTRYSLYFFSLSTMGKKKGKKKWNAHYDKHLGENSNDKGMALKKLDIIFHTTALISLCQALKNKL